MSHFVRIVVLAAGPKPYPIYALLRDRLTAGGTVEVKRWLDAGPIEFRHLDPTGAGALSADLQRLGAVFKTEPDDAPPPPPRKKKPGVANLAAKLAAIGPYTIESDTEDEWVATWEAPPGLESPLGHFHLEFRVEAGEPPHRPDKKMFRLWEAWKARHLEWAAKIQSNVEAWMRQVGVTGPASAAVLWPGVSITRVYDDDYEVSASMGVEFDEEHGPVFRIDEDTGELEFEG